MLLDFSRHNCKGMLLDFSPKSMQDFMLETLYERRELNLTSITRIHIVTYFTYECKTSPKMHDSNASTQIINTLIIIIDNIVTLIIII